MRKDLQHIIKRAPPSQVYLCIYCLGVWSDDVRTCSMEPNEVMTKKINGVDYVMCVACNKAMKLYNRAEAA